MRETTKSHLGERVLITGGAGFIGTNLADRLARSGCEVTIYDNLSRAGVGRNLDWLVNEHSDRIRVEDADIREEKRLKAAVSGADKIFHFAAQVAVTTSVTQPKYDYEVNLGGTINLLEAIRAQHVPPPVLFTSTNKVYGALSDIAMRNDGTRYVPADPGMRSGVSEARRLDFHSPYGCSKGAADQYVLDYARTYGIQSVVFRMSCIYGPHQMGTEDQGWVAHFLIQALKEESITIYGDGLQVRDILFADDLVNAFLLAMSNVERLSGEAFNIGGGPANTVSLVELLDIISVLRHKKTKIQSGDWRVGDQRYYVSDTRKFKEATGWTPAVAVREGVSKLYEWLSQQTQPAAVSERGIHAVLAH